MSGDPARLRFRARHLRLMRNGWTIPRFMEWMFWPPGYQSGLKIDPVEFARGELTRRFAMANRPEFMMMLRVLGAVREERR